MPEGPGFLQQLLSMLGMQQQPERLPDAAITAAKPGQANIEQMLRSPFVQDTLQKIFSGPRTVSDTTLRNVPAFGAVRETEPNHVMLDSDYMDAFDRNGLLQDIDRPELVLAHELMHGEDFNESVPEPIIKLWTKQFLASNPEEASSARDSILKAQDTYNHSEVPWSSTEDIPDDIVNNYAGRLRTPVVEGLAEGMQHALAFISDRAPYDKAENQNLKVLEENAPGATTLLSWIADRMGGGEETP